MCSRPAARARARARRETAVRPGKQHPTYACERYVLRPGAPRVVPLACCCAQPHQRRSAAALARAALLSLGCAAARVRSSSGERGLAQTTLQERSRSTPPPPGMSNQSIYVSLSILSLIALAGAVRPARSTHPAGRPGVARFSALPASPRVRPPSLPPRRFSPLPVASHSPLPVFAAAGRGGGQRRGDDEPVHAPGDAGGGGCEGREEGARAQRGGGSLEMLCAGAWVRRLPLGARAGGERASSIDGAKTTTRVNLNEARGTTRTAWARAGWKPRGSALEAHHTSSPRRSG